MLRTIEIMCIPCAKCEAAKKIILKEIEQIELRNKIKLKYEFKHTPNFHEKDKYSVNTSQAPIVIINGQVELCGVMTPDIVAKKLHRMLTA